MLKVHNQTIAVRLPAKLLRAVMKRKLPDESVSVTVRRLLAFAVEADEFDRALSGRPAEPRP